MQSKADEAEDMKEGQGFRHGSEDPAEEDSLDRTQSNGLDNTQSMGRARRTPRGPAAYSGRSGSRVSPVPLLHHHLYPCGSCQPVSRTPLRPHEWLPSAQTPLPWFTRDQELRANPC